MPYIAIVHVPDHTAARRFIEKIEDTPDNERMVGLFEYPYHLELKCSGGCTNKKLSSWVRDPRGFIKCAVCGSRNKRMRQWLIGHLFDLLGANLYKGAPGAFRTPEGYGPPR